MLKLTINKYIKNNEKLFKFAFIFVIVLPTKNLNFLGGLPFNTFAKFVFLFLITFLIIKSNTLSATHLAILTFLLIFKTFLIFTPTNDWEVCVSDEFTPRQTQFKYDYIETSCTKSFDNLLSSTTLYSEEVNFKLLNEDFEWMGHNSTNLPLGYINHSAYNFYDLRRDWLPFSMLLGKSLDSDTRYLEVSYVGYVKLSFRPSSSTIYLPSSYEKVNSQIIKIPKNTDSVTINYFYKDQNIKKDSTRPFNVPNVFTENKKSAQLIVSELNFEKNNVENLDIYRLLEYFLIFLIFFVYRETFLKLPRNEMIILSLLFILIFILSQADIENIENLYKKIIGYLVLISIFWVKKYKRISIFAVLIILIALNYFLIDEPWNELDFNIKPSGTDILTYENQARLIFEGDGLRGGEDVFWYSPGYRYMLFLVHIFFGDGWGLSWKVILSITIFIASTLSRKNILLSILLIIFLVSDNLRTLYLYGMSETVSLMFLLLSLRYYKHKKLFSFFLSIATLIRPEILLLSAVLIFLNLKIKEYIYATLILLLPLVHNLFYGESFVIFSTAATYTRNINFDFLHNFGYITFNIFDESIRNIMGFVPTFIAFILVILNISVSLYKLKHNNHNLKEVFNILFWALAVLPYLIYDPRLFFPRHVLIGLVILCIDFSDFKFNFFIKNKQTQANN